MECSKPNKSKLSVKSYLRRENLRRMFFLSVIVELCILGAGIYVWSQQARVEDYALFLQILGGIEAYFLACLLYSGALIRKGRIRVKPITYHCFWVINLGIVIFCGLTIIPISYLLLCWCIFVMIWGNVPLFQKIEFIFHALAVSIGGIFLFANYELAEKDLFYAGAIFLLSCQLSRKKCYYKSVEMKKETEDNNVVSFTEYDILTGLDNRIGIDNKVKSLWCSCMESKKTISVFTIHMDEFSKYNEYYGYYEGEYCQKQIAEKIKILALESEGGLAARILEGEFLVVLPDLDAMKSIQWANVLKDAIEELAIPQSKEAIWDYMTVSIGISCGKPNRSSVFTALRLESNRSLRIAKESGFNGVVYKRQRYGQKLKSNKQTFVI